MICNQCNRENDENAEYCSYCGQLLHKNEDSLFEQAVRLLNEEDAACIPLFEKCAREGDSNGYLALGEIYNFGDLVDEDPFEAAKYYHMALNMGNHMALVQLGSLYYCGSLGEENRFQAFDYLKRYEQFFPNECGGLFELARCYKNGIGTPVDIQKAGEYFERALRINPDNTSYLWSYANMLEEDDNPVCISYFEKAANLGDCGAAYSLGNIFYEGNLTQQDYEKAKRYYELAIRLGNEDDELEAECINLSLNQINIINAKQQLNKSNDVIKKLAAAFDALENGSPSLAMEYYRAIPDNVESIFFSAYITSIDVSCEESDYAIDNMKKALRDIVSRVKDQFPSEIKQTELCWNIARYASTFVLNIMDLHYEIYHEMVAYKSVYNRLGPVGFANNVITPRAEAMAEMLYDLGDQIESAFSSREICMNAAKLAWETGNVPMQYASEHGSFFEKSDRKGKLRQYKRKI